MLFRSGAGFIVLAMWLIFANNSKAALRKDFERSFEHQRIVTII